MKIGINASFVRKPDTGIGQVSINFLRKLMENIKYQTCLPVGKVSNIKQDIELVLCLEEDLPQNFKLPKNFTKRIFLPWWKRDDLIRKIWWEKYLLPKKAREDRCDVFLSLYQCPTVFNKIKHIMIVHDIIPKLFPEYLNNSRKKLYWKLTEKAIKKADKIIAVSEYTKKDLIKHLNIAPEKISVNYIDVDGIYKKEVSEEKSREVLEKYNLKPGYIYSGGGLEARKNIERLLKAYKILLKKFPVTPPEADQPLAGNYKLPNLVISGKLMPELAPLITDAEKLVKDLRLQDKVKLLDFVPQEDLPALYKNASVFVYPSLYEGFGLPVLEAMSCGTPAIISKNSSLPEVGGDSVLYVDPENSQDIAEKIEKVLSNSNLQNELSLKGKEQAKKFSWDKFVEKVLALTTI